jgi:hypothetical protein
MSPKKAILRALAGAPDLHPSSLPGYREEPERYQEAVNELLRDRLVEGRKDPEGRMTIALNQHRRRDVERMLRPIWARPAVWAALAILLAVGAGLVAV